MKVITFVLGCILTIIFHPKTAHSQYLRYEVIKGDTVSILRFPRHDKVDIQVNSTVEVNESLVYKYSLISRPTSEQDIYDFKILTEGNIDNVASPANWSVFTGGIIPGVSWGPLDSLNRLAPGKFIKGFSFTSAYLLSIDTYNVHGWAPVPRVEVEPDSVENDLYSENSKKGFTISPGISPEEIEPNAHAVTIQTFLTRSCNELGWIENQGLCRSLEAKLEKVGRQLERESARTASGALEAFLNEVEAHKDKQLSPEAYALLYYNGRYLLEQLIQ